MDSFLQIVTTTDDAEEASRLARLLVYRGLAACVQIIGPVRSVYRWKGTVEEAQEWQLLIKTRAALYGKVEEAIRQEHSYEVPEILAFPVTEGSRSYLDWLASSTN